jgi:hypothetical protein
MPILTHNAPKHNYKRIACRKENPFYRRFFYNIGDLFFYTSDSTRGPRNYFVNDRNTLIRFHDTFCNNVKKWKLENCHLSILYHITLFQLFSCNVQFFIPSLSKFTYKRFLQEFINGNIFFLPQKNSSLADTPAMIIYSL